MLYKKTILTTHEGHTLARYAKDSFKLLFRILKADNKSQLYDLIMELGNQIEEEIPDLHYFITEFNGCFYATVLIEVDNLKNTPVMQFKKMLEKATKRIAQWYVYAYLVPTAQNREPFKTDSYDDEDNND